MDSRDLTECRQGNTGDAEGRRNVLDIDLNQFPPDMDEFNPLDLMGQGHQGQATNVLEVADEDDGDDDVVVISPRHFAETTQRSRRNRRLLDGTFQDCLVINDPRPGIHHPRTALSHDFLLNSPLRRAPNHPNVLTPVPTITCGICLGEMTIETTTKCGHVFCKKCIDTAIAVQHKCPTCRQRLTKRDTIRIYLPKLG